jgi:hypothetical protein
MNCQVCNDPISPKGFAYTSHMRRHVTEGRLVEVWDEHGGPPDSNAFTGRRGRYGYVDAETGRGLNYPLGGSPRDLSASSLEHWKRVAKK